MAKRARAYQADFHRGPLTYEQIASGMNAAYDNGRRLTADARTLLDLKRFPSAFALAVLAFEEYGKSSIIGTFAAHKTPEQRREGWKKYRTHTAKSYPWLIPILVSDGARRPVDFAPLFDGTSQPFAELLDCAKQLAIYTECWPGPKWSTPEKAVNEELTRKLVAVAEIYAKRKHQQTAKSVELYEKHLAPLRGTKHEPHVYDEMALALHRDLVKHGLLPDDAKLDKFFKGELQGMAPSVKHPSGQGSGLASALVCTLLVPKPRETCPIILADQEPLAIRRKNGVADVHSTKAVLRPVVVANGAGFLDYEG